MLSQVVVVTVEMISYGGAAVIPVVIDVATAPLSVSSLREAFSSSISLRYERALTDSLAVSGHALTMIAALSIRRAPSSLEVNA